MAQKSGWETRNWNSIYRNEREFMRYLTACYTDKGKRKDVNQDSLLVSRGRLDGEEAVLAVICDGMGGLSSGELASAEAVHSLAGWFREEMEELAKQEDFEDELYGSWERLLKQVHEKIRSYGQLHDRKMGTTVTAMLFWKENYYIVHIGDSRIYEIKERAVQITKDQTLAELMKAEEKTRKEAPKSEHVLLQALGASKAVKPAYYSGSTKNGAAYLLCTDGFRHKIRNEELLEIFAPGEMTDEAVMRARGEEAARRVLDRGERDNISVILVRTVQEQDCGEVQEVCEDKKGYALEGETVLAHTERIMQ